MKGIFVFTLFVWHSSYCMHEALQEAIKKSDFHTVQKLVAQAKQTHELQRLKTEPVNFSQLQQLALNLTEERNELTTHRSHPAVYTRYLIGSGTILISLFAVGNYFYHTITTHQPNLQSLCAAAGAGITAIVHGVKEIKLGIQNQDAKDVQANHVAITQLLANIQSEHDQDARV